MTTLQLGLIAGGVVVVLGVLLYNWIQERRIKRRIAATFAPATSTVARAGTGGRVEPGFNDDEYEADGAGLARAPAAMRENLAAPEGVTVESDDDFVPPIDFAPERAAPAPSSPALAPTTPVVPLTPLGPVPKITGVERSAQPDPDIESMVTITPARPIAAGALASGLHARVGKPLRWFGRTGGNAAAWQLLKPDTSGSFGEVAACLLLADRAGAATRPMIERFVRLVGEMAASLPGAFAPPDPEREAMRAEALDRFCATLDVQIGLTLLKTGAATIPGTRLRGVAEAAGFRLNDNGRFEWVQEETGMVLFSLQNYRSEPFTVDNLRLTSTPGAVLILDVPRVADPVRVFDQMKLAAKRLMTTLDATLVDDNRRPLTDASLAAIRQQVETTASALRESRLDPGSPRAMALFGG